MTKAVLDSLERALEAAYRGDRWHALLGNLESVTADEWGATPARHSIEVFGTDPELSIADIVCHVAAAKFMWGHHAFGEGTKTWGDFHPGSADRDGIIAWLDEGHRAFVAGVHALADDSELAVDRRTHWGRPLPTERIIQIVINHDLYHAGEINRQRGLIRGAEGWAT